MKDALKREIKEETGLTIFDIRFLFANELIFDRVFWKKKHFIFLDFVCKTKSKKVKLNNEAQKYLWIKPSLALKLPVEPYTKTVIKKYLANPLY